MGRLGVSTKYSREMNLRIIENKYRRYPDITIAQVRNLRRFPAFSHIKGAKWPKCQCLACHALAILEGNSSYIIEK